MSAKFELYNLTGVDLDVRLSMDGHTEQYSVGQGNCRSAEIDIMSKTGNQIRVSAHSEDGPYMAFFDGVFEYDIQDGTVKLTFSVDPSATGSAFTPTQAGYFASCEGGKLVFRDFMNKDQMEERDGYYSTYFAVCQAKGLTQQNLDGVAPLDCGYPLWMWAVGISAWVVFLIIVILVIIVIVGLLVWGIRKVSGRA